jgi:hypothetical protein
MDQERELGSHRRRLPAVRSTAAEKSPAVATVLQW